MKFCFAVLALMVCNSGSAQSTKVIGHQFKTLPADSTFRSFLQAGLAVESERRPKAPFVFEYNVSVDKQRRYFLGIGMDAARHAFSDTDYSYNDHNGTFRNSVLLYSFHFTQKYFFNRGQKVSPFVGFNVGVRSISQDVTFKYITIVSPLFPIPIPVTEKLYDNKQHSLNVMANAGLLFRVNDVAAIASSVGIRSSKEFEMYEGTRKPSCAVFSLGVVVGRIGSRGRKSPPTPVAVPEKKTTPKKNDDSDGF